MGTNRQRAWVAAAAAALVIVGAVFSPGLAARPDEPRQTVAALIVQEKPTAPPTLAAARWAPAHSLAAIRLIEPDKHASKFREYLTSAGFFESPAYQIMQSNPGLMQAQIGLLGLAASVGMDGWTAIGHVLGQDAVLALYPGDGEGAQPKSLIVAIARDAAARQKFLDGVANVAGLMKGGKPDPDKTTMIGDHAVFTLGDLKYAIIGDALVMGSSIDVIERSIKTHAEGRTSIADSGELDAVEDAAPADAMMWATVDAKTILAAANASGGDTSGLIENPLGGFLFGGWVKSLVDAKSAVGWMSEVTDGLSLTALVERNGAMPASHEGFAVKFPALSVDWDAITLPRQMLSMSIARDWADLFSERESILTLPGASQATAFATTMTTLMGNMDFMEDLLPRINGPVRFMLERQDFSKVGYEPTPKLPAFVLVAPIKGGSEDMLKQRLMSSSQMAMSFINLDAARKQQPGYLMGMAEHRGVTILKGTYPPPGTPGAGAMMKDEGRKDKAGDGDDEEMKPAGENDGMMAGGDGVNVRYNFEPMVAVVKDHYISATSMASMRALIDAVLDGSPQNAGSETPEPDVMRIEGEQTTEILRENREELVVQRMLEQDEDRAQAEKIIDALIAMSGMVDSLNLTSQPTPKGGQATIRLTMKPRAEMGAKK